jgi:anthranilate synthase component 2
MEALIKKFAPTKSILGICLGHQGIAEVFNAELFNMPVVLHGVTTRTRVLKPDDVIFRNVPGYLKVCRYHSWAVRSESVNRSLEITAVDEDGTIMGIRHREYAVWGLQFHPEAYLTEHGKIMIDNWLKQ